MPRVAGGASAVACLVLAGCVAPPASREVGPEVAAAIQADVEAFIADADGFGQVRAVLIYRDGEPVLERYTGADETDYWDTRSVTTSVMSALIGIAIHEGHIEGVDATLGDLLPSHADAMTPEVASTTLEQVLTHTGGFAPVDRFRFWQASDWLRAILERRAADGPGDGSFAYSDAGAHVLSAVLDESTGRPVLDYAREKLFDPIGIDSDRAWEGTPSSYTAYIPDPEFLEQYYGAGFAWPTDPQGYHWGDGALKLRPQDLARLGVLFLDGGESGGEQVVPASWVDQSTTTQVADAGSFGYGYLWWVTEADGTTGYAAMGKGGQLVEVVPERELVVVVASEFDDRDPLRERKSVSTSVLSYMVSDVIAPHLP